MSGDGSVDWLCWPRFDSPSVFGRLLDDSAGHWSIRPAEEYDVRRRYLEDTLVLETQFTTSSGMGMLTDALVLDGDERGHDIGRHAPRVLVRSIEVSEGVMSFSAEFQPKPEYGVVEPRLELKDQTLLSHGGAVLLALSGPPPNELGRSVATWFVTLAAGEATCFALEYRHRERTSDVHQWSGRQSRRALAGTVKAWRSWSELHQRYEGPAKALVHHSGRVLQALTYQPTGAIVAAPTTSLGEVVGGSRNWDYRYGWIRDASMTMRALWIAACPDEAGRFLRWIVETVGAGGGKRPALQIMYGVGGEHDLSERELTHLEGWRQSRPVRVGNGAWNQIQHDIYGELLDAVLTLHEQLGPPDAATRSFLLEVADASAMVWEEPDAGIWEGRGSPKHHLYSKLMCWVALDRAIQLADWLGATDRVPGWEAVRTAIRAAILDQGWNEDLQCFTQCFGGRDLDASSLMLAISGFLPVDDTRMASTISKVGTALAAPCGLLYRYSGDDGVGGGGRGLAALLVLDGRVSGRTRRCRWGVRAVRAGHGLRQRSRAPQRGGRPPAGRTGWQLSAGIQPHRTGQRGMGPRPHVPPVILVAFVRSVQSQARETGGRDEADGFGSGGQSLVKRHGPPALGPPDRLTGRSDNPHPTR